jgi:hypothetical protein
VTPKNEKSQAKLAKKISEVYSTKELLQKM